MYMTKNDLINIINQTWDCDYVGSLKLEQTKYGFIVKLGIPDVDAPTIIQGDLPEEKFLKFFKEQIRGMNVDGFYMYKINRRIIDEPSVQTQLIC